ncbi:MAG: hypothetical protein ACLQFR_06105 [Streptosporangiaceae bacterium]
MVANLRPVTLLLTCVTHRFVVQASDRRLILPNGDVVEDIANKATLLGNHATFAYTGLARCSVTERTDELLLRCLAEPNVPIIQVFDKLAKSAAQSIRGLSLPVRPSERRVLRRTSFVGAGFLGIRNPVRFLRQPSADELHPFMVVISNAQGRKEEWRPVADQDFSISLVLLAEDEPFGLHAAGQPFIGPERSALERDIRRCLGRISRPESVARLLARAVRTVAARNRKVGPNVMCTMVRRDRVPSAPGTFTSGLVPMAAGRPEADYFRWPRDDIAGQWIFSPAEPTALICYGPNYAGPGMALQGIRFGPSAAVAQP